MLLLFAAATAVLVAKLLHYHVLQDAFEAKYNFRFEETGGADITSYSREVCIIHIHYYNYCVTTMRNIVHGTSHYRNKVMVHLILRTGIQHVTDYVVTVIAHMLRTHTV